LSADEQVLSYFFDCVAFIEPQQRLRSG